VLLHIKGVPGREWASVGEIAERLQLQPHGVVALVTRCEALALVQRRPSETDRRQVEVHLLAKGERLLLRLAELHRAELRSLKGVFEVPQIDLPDPAMTPASHSAARRLRAQHAPAAHHRHGRRHRRHQHRGRARAARPDPLLHQPVLLPDLLAGRPLAGRRTRWAPGSSWCR
jgi:Mn-dependent DtxR family transcriptional regulator